MEMTITGRHLEITPAIRAYAEKRTAKLPKYFDRLRLVHVVVDKSEKHFGVEMHATADRAEAFVAKVHGEDLYACIDEAVEKLERQLTDHKDTVRHHRGKTPMSGN